MRRRAVILLVLVSLLIVVMGAAANASPGQAFYLEKSCTDVCEITHAEGPFNVLIGEMINYQDRVLRENPSGHFLETARITVVDDVGNTLLGQIRFKDVAGHFTITKGTGAFQGVHANGTIVFKEVAADGRWVYALEGTYHFENN